MSNSRKNILITGADGFIGSHLTELLSDEGYSVKALSQYNSYNNWGWLEDVSCLDQIEILNGDIRDPHYCKKITKDIDIIFHLAALIAIPYSYVAPQSYIATNVEGTMNICQGALENSVSKIIVTSTSEVYGSANYVPIDEKHPLQPQSPYSASKIGADAMAMSYYNSFDLPLIIARPFNTYGPRQSARAIIPTIITQIANQNEKIMIGDISPTRDFNFVTDTCKGILSLARCPDAIGETVNIGSNSELSIEQIINLIRNLMDSDIDLVVDDDRIRPKKSEVSRLWCDNTKMSELTGYKTEYSIEEGLRKTIDWFTLPENIAKYKAEIYNI